MADGTTFLNASDVEEKLEMDEISTLNGSALSPTRKATRSKIGYGSDGTFRDVDDTHPLPVAQRKGSTVSSTYVTVGASSVTVLASNANRLSVTIVNDSDAIIYLKLGGVAAVLNSGIRLNPNGGMWQDDTYTGEIRAISYAAGKNLCVAEVASA